MGLLPSTVINPSVVTTAYVAHHCKIVHAFPDTRGCVHQSNLCLCVFVAGLQEHYCVTVGMNDATGAFRQFGLDRSARPNLAVPCAD